MEKKESVQSDKPLIGISVGDPAGVGPEITAKALSLAEIHEVCRPLVVGEAGIMRQAVRFSGLDLRFMLSLFPRKVFTNWERFVFWT